MYLWPQKPSQYWFHMCGRANPPKNSSFKLFSLSLGPSKILHPLSEGCGNRLTIWQIRRRKTNRETVTLSRKFALCGEEQSHQHCWFTIWRHEAFKKNYKRNAKLRWWEIHIGRFGTNPFKITHEAEETVGGCGRWNKIGWGRKKK